ncbi:MAG: hypothetical protein JWQ88_3689 [Rhodoferax sp.]|nr:hypothetical protein [Rhodoferax sp.]
MGARQGPALAFGWGGQAGTVGAPHCAMDRKFVRRMGQNS